MLKTTFFTLVALLTVAVAIPASTTGAQAGCSLCYKLPPPPLPTPGPNQGPDNGKPADEGPEFADGKIQMLIACRIKGAGDAAELHFRNIGDVTIPVGTRIKWTVGSSGQGGEFAAPYDLPVGRDFSAADLLKAGVPAGADCLSQVA